MPFSDELLLVIRKAQEDKSLEERETHEFETAWDALRQSLVLPIFKDAARAFEQAGVGGSADLDNGSVVLEAVWQRSSFLHRLTFSQDTRRRKAVCFSSLEGYPEESFDLGNLTDAVVRAKLVPFAYTVTRGWPTLAMQIGDRWVGGESEDRPAPRGGALKFRT